MVLCISVVLCITCVCVCVRVCGCLNACFIVSGLRVLCCHANKYENTNLGTCEHDEFHAW